ncbi:MAG: hypothetical protein PHX83_13185 [Acidobacteriia bacterium]|nr:hypothetical protein [Terriglobia bacterium]
MNRRRSLYQLGGRSANGVEKLGCAEEEMILWEQRLSHNAYEKIIAAQEANEWDMEGHAAKAKDLLEQANRELKQAAAAANQNRK